MQKEELIEDIVNSIREVTNQKEALQVKSLSRHNPEKVAEILYLNSIGNSQTRMVKKYGFNRETVISVLIDYADYTGKFRELAGRLAAKKKPLPSRLFEY